MDKVGRKQRKTNPINSLRCSVQNKQLYHQGSNDIVFLGIPASISKAKRMGKWNYARKIGKEKVQIASETKK